MVLNTFNILMLPVAICLTLCILWFGFIITKRHYPSLPYSECILAAGIFCVLFLNAEVYILSAIPMERPLQWLTIFHMTLLLLCVLGILRAGGVRCFFDSLRGAVRAFRNLLSGAGLLTSTWGFLVIILLMAYLGYGAYSVPTAWDELSYHLPLAIQPFQDGKIGAIDSPIPWTKTYPRGVELIWYWTLQVTHSDLLFHPVQWAFGLQLLLASYVLARRMGTPVWASLMACSILGTMPLFFILTVTGYIDIAYAAGVITLLSFMAPARDEYPSYSRDWLFAALAFAQCCLIKAPAVATCFGLLAYASLLCRPHTTRSVLRETMHFACSWKGILAVCIIVLSAYTYIRNWVYYNNPLFPIGLSIGKHQIFPGLFSSSQFGSGASSTMGNISEMSKWRQFYAAWADVFNPLTVDSLGSTGLAFLLSITFSFLIFSLNACARRHRWHLALTLMVIMGYAIPGSLMPRYGLPMITIMVVAGTWMISQLYDRYRTVIVLGLACLCVIGARTPLSQLKNFPAYIRGCSGGRFFTKYRNSSILETVQLGYQDFYPTPQIIRFIKSSSGPDDTLAWNVACFHGMLWNRSYSNRVLFLPGTATDRYPGSPFLMSEPSKTELQKWLVEIGRIRPRHILLYKKSAYARFLNTNPGFNYRVVISDDESRGKASTVVFERQPDEA